MQTILIGLDLFRKIAKPYSLSSLDLSFFPRPNLHVMVFLSFLARSAYLLTGLYILLCVKYQSVNHINIGLLLRTGNWVMHLGYFFNQNWRPDRLTSEI